MITKKLHSVTAALPMVTDGNKAACLRKPVDTKERLDSEADSERSTDGFDAGGDGSIGHGGHPGRDQPR